MATLVPTFAYVKMRRFRKRAARFIVDEKPSFSGKFNVFLGKPAPLRSKSPLTAY
jgi:hypothetical protein